MPTYDYKCPECKLEYSANYSIQDKPDKMLCQKCNVPMLQVYGVPVVTFAGEGFYSTDKKKKKGGTNSNKNNG